MFGPGDIAVLTICIQLLEEQRLMNKQHKHGYPVVISEAQLRQRISSLGEQISKDFEGRVVHCVGVLENGFLFVADLVRTITCEVHCEFIKPYTHVFRDRGTETTQIFYAPETDVCGKHILLCEGILSTGQTTDFLIRNFQVRGAASIAICSLLDRPSDRRVDLDVAYYGFRVGPQWLAGFGLGPGSHALQSNLPYIFAAPEARVS
jgi:hypoxanthine phosphoribosyltransferase